MKPIGLTLKDTRYNPFTKKTSGELMLKHVCLNCGKISYNRIAGDDNPHSILSLLKESATAKDTMLLTLEDKEQVLIVLFGYNYQDI
jgi:hypothetical protein